MALSAAQLATLVEQVKLALRIADDDATLHTDALAVYHDQSASATAATVQVESSSLSLVITGGANAGTDTFDLTNDSYDTLTELVDAINALSEGWVATLLGRDEADSSLIVRKASTSAYGQANEVTLAIENNELLEMLITAIFDALETAMGRELLSTSYTGDVYRDVGRDLILEHPNVSSIELMATEQDAAITVSYTGTGTNARVEVTDSAVKLVSRAGATTTTNTINFADQATTALMATAISAVSGWTGTSVATYPSAYLVRQGPRDAKAQSVTLEVWNDCDTGYEVDYDEGRVTFWDDIEDARIDYTAGYSSLPADLAQVIVAATKAAWDSTAKDLAVQSERLGDYAYTLGDVRQAAAAGLELTPWEGIVRRYARILP